MRGLVAGRWIWVVGVEPMSVTASGTSGVPA